MIKATVINNIKIVGLALILAVGMSYAYAWTAPTATPPANNVAAPINTSANAQLKNGPLGVNGYFTAYSGMSANNNLIKEVATPIDGTDAVNKDYVDAATGGGGSIQCFLGPSPDGTPMCVNTVNGRWCEWVTNLSMGSTGWNCVASNAGYSNIHI